MGANSYELVARSEVDCSIVGNSALDMGDDEDPLGARAADNREAVKQAPPPVDSAEPGFRTVAMAVALYAACSSTLLLINAVAVRQTKDASFVLFCQFAFSTVTVRAIRCARPEVDVELITWEKGRPFLLACLVFFLCLLSNTQALKSVNPETVIVARSCSPVAVCILEHVTLGRDLPSNQGVMALVAIAGGAFIYVLADAGFHIEGYVWLTVYYMFIVTEMVFVKYVVDNVKMSTWTRVYYNNTLSIPMVLVSSMFLGFGKFMEAEWTPATMSVLVLSCWVGLAISYAGFNLRKLVSATSFTVVGVVCKLITILINDVMWSHHSNAMGHVGLLVCIVAGFAYERTKGKGK